MEQARKGRLQLLDSMASAINEGREDISPFAPRIIQIKIDVDQIRNVIGPGGKMIRHIVDTTGAKINVEDDGTVQIATADMEAAQKAIQMIEGLTKQPLIGEEFDGVARRIEPYGAFVEILPGRDGLVHISELSLERIPDIRDVLNEGDELRVRIIDIDANDRIKLSRRVILEDEARERGEEIPERDTSPPRRETAVVVLRRWPRTPRRWPRPRTASELISRTSKIYKPAAWPAFLCPRPLGR